uniref:M10 family metallopeptidase C-terminal domain-containing protein n=1 Tax=Microvirga roseola TaxID=2883126 RepID=UPI001E2A7F31
MSFWGWIEEAGEYLGGRAEAVGDWLGDRVEDGYEWLSDNISGLPLHFFSFMGQLFPSVNILGVKSFTPSHGDNDVNGLMAGSKWAGSTITFALPDSQDDYEIINPSASGYKPLSAQNEAAVHEIMGSFAGYVSVGVNYAGRGDATIQVAGFEHGDIINRSHGMYAGVPLFGSDTWLTTGSSTSVLTGSRDYFLALHELGHSLGLKHPHDSAGNLPLMSSSLDSTEFTVMSYKETANRPQSYMQYDIAALQYMYGADFTTQSGNTVYSWNPDTGQTFVNGVSQGSTSDKFIFLTIWDGGGIDTYDMSKYSEGGLIDLSPGGFSRFSTEQLAVRRSESKVSGNVYNAFQCNGDPRSLIENAIGGSGNDTIIGNQAINHLRGEGGDDKLSGGAGADRLDGGGGRDTVSYYHRPVAVE